MAATANPLASADDIEAGPKAELRQSSGTIIPLADVGLVQFQLRFLARLHKPDGSRLSALAYVGYALLLVSWYAAPKSWYVGAADGSSAVCAEGRIELDGTGAVELMRDEGSLCLGGNHSHASMVCDAVGARLCTLDEVVGGDAHLANIACRDPDPRAFTWTASSTNEEGEKCPAGQHMSSAADPNVADRNPPTCSLDTEHVRFFCCADARVNPRTTCPSIETMGDNMDWPEWCTSAKSCSELVEQWPEGVWRLAADPTAQAWAVVFAFMYCPATIAIWHALCRIGKPGVGEMHALLGGVEGLSEDEVGAIRWWRNLVFGITVPLSTMCELSGLLQMGSVDTWNADIFFVRQWFVMIFAPPTFLAGSLWVLTLKTASVAGCHTVGNTEDLVTSWVARLPRSKSPAPNVDLGTDSDESTEPAVACMDEIGTAIVELNERVPHLGAGWGLSIAFGMLGSVGCFIMMVPFVIRGFTAAETKTLGLTIALLVVIWRASDGASCAAGLRHR
eukprot:COSAG04_NODE_1415_length_6863_cov_9.475163_4_plen_506_part_00